MADQSELMRMLSALEPGLREEIEQSVTRGLAPLDIPEPIRLSEWAEQHFYLSAESSYTEGRWKCYPFQRAILDCIGNDAIRVLDLRKSARVGYTKMVLAGVCYFAEHKRRNQVLYQPTDDDRDEFVVTELDPALRDVEIIRSIFPKMHSRSKDNTFRLKKFSTGALHLRGGKAAKNYRRLTVDVVWYDELDGFDRDIEGEGSPLKLGDKRLEGSIFPKSVRGTTPKTKNLSHIEDAEADADIRFRFHVPCPHCAGEHPIEWGGKAVPHGFKWVNNDPETVRHVCPHCGAAISQADYLEIWEAGRWVAPDGTWIDPGGWFISAGGAVVDPPAHVAFHVWTGYSKQATWPQIVREFLAANERAKRGDTSELKTFVNTTLGETYEERTETADEHALQRRARAEQPQYDLGVVPAGCLVLTAGVDVQGDRFEIVVWGFGAGEEMWAVDQRVIAANPADERDWARLDEYLRTRFPQAGRLTSLPIEAVGIDIGGHFTHQVYYFTRTRVARRIFGVEGAEKAGKPIKGAAFKRDVNLHGKVLKKGVSVWEVGTDTAKDLLYGRLRVSVPGPGFVHFSHQLETEFFLQLTAEGRVMKRTPTGEKYVWVKRRARNEVLDCTVYALWAAHYLDLHRRDAAFWERLRAKVEPAEVPALVSIAAPEVATAPRRAAPAKTAEPRERNRFGQQSKGRDW